MKFSLLIVLVLTSQALFSQKLKDSLATNPAVGVIARSFGDSIIIRWGVTAPLGWKLSNKSGYMIERYTLLKDGKIDKKNSPEKIILSPNPIKPWPLEKWEAIIKDNDYAKIAAQALYGKEFKIENKKTQDVMQMVSLSQELEMRASFAQFSADQSLKVAEASGLKFTDRTVKKGESYVYKVYSLVPANTYAIDTGSVFIGTNDNSPLPKPLDLKADFSDRVVMLNWNKTYYQHIYSTYFIERSSDGGKTFIRTDELPIINTSPGTEGNAHRMYKIDSLPANNVPYVFRVRGITPFEEVSPPSDTVQGMGKSVAIQLAPHINSAKNLKNGNIEIQWRFPKEYNSKISEFEIMKANRSNGEYKSIAKVNTELRIYEDKKPERINYYIVRVKETNGSYFSSFPAMAQLIDSIAPVTPTGLKGDINKNGIVKLSWATGKDIDIAGYRIYMANNPNEAYTQTTNELVRDTVFIDTININTITSKVYYKVMAVDLNYNLSSFSNSLEIKRPDIIPPASPVLETYAASDTSIYLKWIPSSSKDVAKHIVYRREKYSNSWNPVYETKSKINVYTDRDVKMKTNYEYVIVAVDSANLESEKRQIVTLSIIDYGFRTEITHTEAKVDRLNKKVEIKWEYENAKPEKFLIYRAEKGQPLRLYKATDGNVRIFVDKVLRMNTIYVYRIKASFSDGGESPFSQELEVKY